MKTSPEEHLETGQLGQIRLMVAVGFRSAFRKNRLTQVLSFILLGLVFIPIAVYVGALAARASAPSIAAAPSGGYEWLLLGILVATLFFRGLVAAGSPLDATKLFLYPVSHGRVLVASLIYQALGPALAVFAGLFVGSVVGDLRAPIVAWRGLVVLAFLVHVHLLSLLARLFLSNLLRLRVWRDLGTVLGSLFVVSAYLVAHVARRPEVREPIARWLESASPLLSVIPATWAARALHPDTPPIHAALYLLAFAAATLLVGRLATRLQRLAFFGEVAFSGPSRLAARSGLSRSWRWKALPTEIGAVTAKDLQTLRRDPIVKDLLIRQVGLVLVPLMAVLLGTEAPRQPEVLVCIILSSLLLGETVILLNLFSLDDRGIVTLFSTSAPRWKILVGKNLAAFLLFAPLNVGLSAAALVILGEPRHLPFAAAVGATSIVCTLAVGNFASSLLPLPLLARRKQALGSDPQNQGCSSWLVRLLLTLAAALLSAPAGLIVGVPLALAGAWTYTLTLPLAAAYSLAVYLGTLRAAAGQLERREEKLMETMAWRK